MIPYARITLFTLALSVLLAVSLFAVAPTDEARERWKAEGIYDRQIQNWTDFKAAGGCEPNENTPFPEGRVGTRTALDANAVDTLKVLVILVDFPDCKYDQSTYAIPGGGTLTMNAVGTAAKFDSLLFSVATVPTGSMTDFYWETSYQRILIQGTSVGWYTMPQNYSYYVGTNDGLTMGSTLAGHAILAADAGGVDFTQYDNDDDETVEGVIIIHAGPGAETGAYGIWSHKSNPSGAGLPDGMLVASYTMNPEEYGSGLSTVGVYCHEWGHVMGLPDLYDINETNSPNNDGLGDWSLMAGGSWNDNGRHPAHLDAWCKTQLGLATITWLSANEKQVAVPAIQYNPVVYGLRNTTVSTSQYWLIENRRKVGFDAYIPWHGLMIYHVDNSVGTNDNPDRLHVGLEQADGMFSLEQVGGSDVGDPWPGSADKRNFNDRTVPNSRTNIAGAVTQVGVWNISNSDSLMYADMDIRWSRPYVEFFGSDSIAISDAAGGDNDGLYEQGETVTFNCRIRNTMLSVGMARMHLSCDNPNLTILNNDGLSSAVLTSNTNVTLATPMQIQIPANFQSRKVNFTLQVSIDSTTSPGNDSTFSHTFTFARSFGAPQILVVDDDNGQLRSGVGYEKRIKDALDRLGFPYVVWTKLTQGSPTPSTMFQYLSVVWYTGPSSQDGGDYGGVLTVADVTAMKAHLDAGGSLLLSSNTGADQLNALDPSFLTNYLHCTLDGHIPVDEFAQEYHGVTGSSIGDGLKIQFGSSEPVYYMGALLDTINGGQFEFYGQGEMGGTVYGYIGVSYLGTYRTLFLTVPIESTNDGLIAQGWAPRDSLLMRALNFYQGSPVVPAISYLRVQGESDINHVVTNSPTLQWSYVHWLGITPQQYELEVGTDNEWSTAEMWAPATVPTGDSSVAYGGASLADGQTYFVRVRAHDGTDWTTWFVFAMRLNTAPSAAAPLDPVDGAISATGNLTTTNAADAESDGLAYQFQVYADSAGTSLLRSSSDVSETPSTTGWVIAPALPDDNTYWWRVRAYDGTEYSSWSALEKFVLNASSQAPSAFTLTSPPEPSNLPVFDLKPTFSWSAASDTDPGDTVRYRLEIDDNSGLTTPTTVDSLLITSHEVADSLAFGTQYWWRVTAYDKSGLSTQATVKDFWTWQLGDVDHSHGTDIGDLTVLINNLFITFDPINPPLVADVTGDCQVDIGDLTALINNLFITFGPLGIGCQ